LWVLEDTPDAGTPRRHQSAPHDPPQRTAPAA
jgi:hypothetical protein